MCNVTIITVIDGQRFLLSADRHWDNPKSDWDLQLKHLNQCKEYGAGIIDIGDLFCCMQGKYDKRANKSDLRPEHQREDYFDSLIETAKDFFKPFNFVLIGHGNHETAVLKRHETDLTQRLITAIDPKIIHGYYSGWIIFKLPSKKEINLFYHHGYGGGGPVTKGTIQTARRAIYTPDADIILTGHIHEAWDLEIPRIRLRNHELYQDTQLHIQLPTYKNEFGSSGWATQEGHAPKPIGAKWIIFEGDDFRIERAK